MFSARPALSPRFSTASGSSPRSTFAGSAGDSTFRPKSLSRGAPPMNRRGKLPRLSGVKALTDFTAYAALKGRSSKVIHTFACFTQHTPSGGIEFRQQFIRSPHVWNHYGAAYHQRHVDGFFLLGASHAQAVGLNQVVGNAVVATQTGGGNQAHQLLVFCGQSAFEVRVVIQIVEAFDKQVIGLVDVFIQTGAAVQKMPGEFAFFSYLLLGEEIGGLFAVSGH